MANFGKIAGAVCLVVLPLLLHGCARESAHEPVALVDSHGGRMWATDHAPRGASFYLTLPTAMATPALANRGEERDTPARSDSFGHGDHDTARTAASSSGLQ